VLSTFIDPFKKQSIKAEPDFTIPHFCNKRLLYIFFYPAKASDRFLCKIMGIFLATEKENVLLFLFFFSSFKRMLYFCKLEHSVKKITSSARQKGCSNSAGFFTFYSGFLELWTLSLCILFCYLNQFYSVYLGFWHAQLTWIMWLELRVKQNSSNYHATSKMFF